MQFCTCGDVRVEHQEAELFFAFLVVDGGDQHIRILTSVTVVCPTERSITISSSPIQLQMPTPTARMTNSMRFRPFRLQVSCQRQT